MNFESFCINDEAFFLKLDSFCINVESFFLKLDTICINLDTLPINLEALTPLSVVKIELGLGVV
ncbi:hypothetical protein DFQ04_0083 [Algoriphagus boseongensis]|uniref:Uncharacterized protein n=1 Tax=Algoriphagus boseongensis TaxID=1442587 RepID=A0A4R6T9Q3_9BACT|nr:hypothetical protein DFQ04_0083 [Algoriphagus boseongensis]